MEEKKISKSTFMEEKKISKSTFWAGIILTIIICTVIFISLLGFLKENREMQNFILIDKGLLWGARENIQNLKWFQSIDLKTIPPDLQRAWILQGAFFQATLEKRTFEIFSQYFKDGIFNKDLTLLDKFGGIWVLDLDKGGLNKVGKIQAPNLTPQSTGQLTATVTATVTVKKKK